MKRQRGDSPMCEGCERLDQYLTFDQHEVEPDARPEELRDRRVNMSHEPQGVSKPGPFGKERGGFRRPSGHRSFGEEQRVTSFFHPSREESSPTMS
jgi:hypothetical protein